jgi:hypothetical protein
VRRHVLEDGAGDLGLGRLQQARRLGPLDTFERPRRALRVETQQLAGET